MSKFKYNKHRKPQGQDLRRPPGTHYGSMSGIDMMAEDRGGRYLGEVQAVSYAINREVAPIYLRGDMQPVSMNVGRETLSGSFIYIGGEGSVPADRLPPAFNIRMSAANEYGLRQEMIIRDVEPLQPVATEQQVAFVAHSVVPWRQQH